EIMMVALVSLLVIGPERLPKVARIAGYWIGKTRRMIAAAKAEISAELHAEEIRQALKQQGGLSEFHDLIDETNNSAHSLKSSLERLQHDSLTHPDDRHDAT
ncbi:MAG: twin-arginine translocase TatA/TatE family subunit, partial [Gammaproteobacteria bacterium]